MKVLNVGNIRKRIGRFNIVIKIINSRVNSFDACIDRRYGRFNNRPFRNNMKYMHDLVVSLRDLSLIKTDTSQPIDCV